MKKTISALFILSASTLFAYQEKAIFEAMTVQQEELLPYVQKAVHRATEEEKNNAKITNFNCNNVEKELLNNKMMQDEIISNIEKKDYEILKKRYIKARCQIIQSIGNNFDLIDKNLTVNERNELKQIVENSQIKVKNATLEKLQKEK